VKMFRSKNGQGMSEYLIILALVAIATIGAVVWFADNVREQIANISEEITGQDAVVDFDKWSRQASATGQYDLDTYTDSDQ